MRVLTCRSCCLVSEFSTLRLECTMRFDQLVLHEFSYGTPYILPFYYQVSNVRMYTGDVLIIAVRLDGQKCPNTGTRTAHQAWFVLVRTFIGAWWKSEGVSYGIYPTDKSNKERAGSMQRNDCHLETAGNTNIDKQRYTFCYSLATAGHGTLHT